MQLTGPVFLFLFLPVTMLLLCFCPTKHRFILLSALSAVFYVLANRDNPYGILTVFGLVLLSYPAVLPDPARWPRIRQILGTVLPIALLLFARLAAEYGFLPGYRYPYGLTFVVLGMISAVTDRLRGEAPRPHCFTDLSGYLLFFPLLSFGPVLRFGQFCRLRESARLSTASFARGARLYMDGYMLRIAVSAVFLQVITRVIELCAEQMYAVILLILPALSLFLFFCFFNGCSRMACGLCDMLGFPLPYGAEQEKTGALSRYLPGALFASLHEYFSEYIARPIGKRTGGRWGSVAVFFAEAVLTALFFRTRPAFLLFCLPLFALLSVPVLRGEHAPRPRLPWRLLYAFFAYLCVSLAALAALFPDPMRLIRSVRLNGPDAQYLFYRAYCTVADTPYLFLLAGVVLLLLPASRLYRHLLSRAGERGAVCLRVLPFAARLCGFAFTLIYFMPQFPKYAELPCMILHL